MTITLTCSFCGKRETHGNNWDFKGWFTIMPHDGSLKGRSVCCEEHGASWLMRRDLEREKQETMVQERRSVSSSGVRLTE